MKKALAILAVTTLIAFALVAQSGPTFTPEQQKQYGRCTQEAEKFQSQVRELAKAAQAPEFNLEKVRVLAAGVGKQYTAMHEQHKELMDKLPADQSAAVEARKKVMDQACVKIRASLKVLDKEVASPKPGATGIAKEAGVIETAMNDWQREHRAIGQQMGVK